MEDGRMFILTRRVSAAVLVALIGCGAAAAADLAEAEKRICAAWDRHKSLTATLTISRHVATEHGTMDHREEGRLEVLKADGKIMARVELKSVLRRRQGDRQTSMEDRSTTIIDGDFAYVIVEADGKKRVVKTDVDPTMSGNPRALLAELRKHNELKLVAEAKVGDRSAFVIEARAKDKPIRPGAASKTACFFDQQAGSLLKIISYDEQDKPIGMLAYTDIQYDVEIDPKRFKFKLPEGAELIDHTTP